MAKAFQVRQSDCPQLDLFQSFICNSEDEEARLSNTAGLWDAIPKYFTPLQQKKIIQAYLKQERPLIVTRLFKFRSIEYQVEITPAIVQVSNRKETIRFPGKREEAIEDILRKLASCPKFGSLNRNRLIVSFSISQIRKMLPRLGQTMNHLDVVEALDVMLKSNIKLRRLGEEQSLLSSGILTALGVRSRAEYESDPNSRCSARFNDLINEALLTLDYRQYDYIWSWEHSSSIARWIHKRMSHQFMQASITNPFNILMSTIIRDSGLFDKSFSPNTAAKRTCQALKELKETKVILDFTEDRRYQIIPNRRGRPPLQDILFNLHPHPKFVRQVKAALKRINQSRIYLESCQS